MPLIIWGASHLLPALMGGDRNVPTTPQLQLQGYSHHELLSCSEGFKGTATETLRLLLRLSNDQQKKRDEWAGRGGAGRDVGGEKVLTRSLPTARRGVP